jgi:basic amino acid/polyamine antiporter, APA family
MMGNMIGVGIFIYPVLISVHLPHPFWFVAIWMIGGLIALTGALSSAELGTFFPEAGGDYAYLRNAYGRRWAFLYGFLTFFITYPGSIAIGVGLTVHYQGESLFGPWVRDIFLKFPIWILGSITTKY